MMKQSKLSYGATQRARRKDIRIVAFAATDAGHPFGVSESVILSVLGNIGIQCSAAELRRELCYLDEKGIIRLHRLEGAPWMAQLVGPATGIAEHGSHAAASTFTETADSATRRRPAGKAARGDSRRSKRVSG